MSDKSLWDSCLSFFEDSLPPQQFNSWIKPLAFEIKGNQITLTAPNSFTLKLVQERFLPEISKRAETFLSGSPCFELRIGKKSSAQPAPKQPTTDSNIAQFVSQPIPKTHKSQNKLNPLLSFDNFVTGKANQLAHAAAIQVAESPGITYNPLFIYGGWFR